MKNYERKSYGFYINIETGESENSDDIINKLQSRYDALEAEKTALLSVTVKQLIEDYKNNEEFESPHVIFQMAQHVDELEARISDLQLRDDYVSDLEDQALLLEARVKSYEQALQRIENPVKAFIEDAEKEGCKLDGHAAISLGKDAEILKQWARSALTLRDKNVFSDCGCRFADDYTSTVILCDSCSKLPCHNKGESYAK